jgi:undecaprenyl-diphosphatase
MEPSGQEPVRGKRLARLIELLGLELFAGLLLAILSAAIFLWLSNSVFMGSTIFFDDYVRQTLHESSTKTFTDLMKIASFLGSFIWLFPLGLVFFLCFLIVKWHRAAMLFLIGMAGEQIMDPLLKNFFHRARPETFFDYPVPLSYSFPSGHAFAALCFYGILAWLIAERAESAFLKTAIWIVAFPLIFFIGLSRIYLGVHYPSDVLAGYLMAFVWVMTIAIADFWLEQRKKRTSV